MNKLSTVHWFQRVGSKKKPARRVDLLLFSPPIKNLHDITEILFKVALNTIILTLAPNVVSDIENINPLST